MPVDCEAVREQLDAWALGALDERERRGVEAHLGGCTACAHLGEEALEAAAAVALGAPLRSGSATLRSRVMASARALGEAEHRGAPRWWRFGAGAAAALAFAAITWGAVMQTRFNDANTELAAIASAATVQAADVTSLRTQVAKEATLRADLDAAVETQNEVLDIVVQPGLQWTSLSGTAAAPGARALCAWSRAEAVGAVLADGLPPAPAGKAYVFWIVYERRWLSGGTLDVDDAGRGRLVVRKIWGREDVGPFVGYAVTLEEAGVEAQRPGDDMVLASSMWP